MALYSLRHAQLLSRFRKSLAKAVTWPMGDRMHHHRSVWKRDLRIGAFVAVVALCFLITGLADILSYDLLFAVKPPTEAAEEISIVYIDDESHRVLDQKYRPDSWDRTLHAQLIEKLTRFGARAVVFDVLFDQTTNEEADRELVDASRKSGKVVVAGVVEAKRMSGTTLWESQPPFAELEEVAHWGAAESPETRRHYRDPNVGVPSLAARAAELFSGITNLAPQERWLNYYGPAGTLPWRSYHEVLKDDAVAAGLSNKVVFVGENVTIGSADKKPSPYTLWTGVPSPGVDFNATAYLNIVRREALLRLPVIAEITLVIVFGVTLPMLLGRLLPILSTVVSVLLAALVFAATCFIAHEFHYWFPWLVVSGVEVPCAFVSLMILRAQRMTEMLRATAAASSASSATKTAPMAPATNRTVVIDDANLADAPVIPDYTMIRNIGSGAFGEVWLAQSIIGGYRAVKVVHRSRFNEDRPFDREFEGMQHFEPISRRHPGLVQILHVGRNRERGYFFYVMELADDVKNAASIEPQTYEARTLSAEISKRGALPVRECVQLAVQLTEALGFLHGEGLIHRDIKPANIIYSGGRPKFADIGLVTQMGNDRTWVGTQGYFPPEGTGTALADIYSLGKTLYRACTGLAVDRFPELPTTLPDTEDVQIFQRLNRIIIKTCEADPARRYRTVLELQSELMELAPKP